MKFPLKHGELTSPYSWPDSAQPDYTDRMPLGIDLHEGAKRVLVLGCGPAQGLIEYARTVPDIEFVGIDFNRSYIDTAQENAPSNCIFECAAFNELLGGGIGDEPGFDYVYVWGTFSYVHESVRRQIYQVFDEHCKIGGHAFLCYNNALFMKRMIVLRDVATMLKRQDESIEPGEILPILRFMFPSGPENDHIMEMLEDPRKIKHFITQQFWEPQYSPVVAERMQTLGFEYAPVEGITSCQSALLAESRNPEEAYRVERWKRVNVANFSELPLSQF